MTSSSVLSSLHSLPRVEGFFVYQRRCSPPCPSTFSRKTSNVCRFRPSDSESIRIQGLRQSAFAAARLNVWAPQTCRHCFFWLPIDSPSSLRFLPTHRWASAIAPKASVKRWATDSGASCPKSNSRATKTTSGNNKGDSERPSQIQTQSPQLKRAVTGAQARLSLS